MSKRVIEKIYCDYCSMELIGFNKVALKSTAMLKKVSGEREQQYREFTIEPSHNNGLSVDICNVCFEEAIAEISNSFREKKLNEAN